MGEYFSGGRKNDELIDYLVEAGFIRTPLVQQVFRAVDRGNYVNDPDQRDNAYKDFALKIGNLHLSSPCVYSKVMEALKLQPGLSFLNLGSGSGYLSTIAGLILGPYGINHGIELHQDNVDFAYDRLNDFIANANAIDEYDFCEPSFFVGNCLLLDNSCQQYDRIYCSATCPAEYESYIKNLVKVGGILVMALEDKLLKFTRIGESTWSITQVFSVYFDPLITPPSLAEHEHAKYIKLDSFCPPKLQDICRFNIRAILRKNIDKDYPNLKNNQRQVEIKPRRQVCSIFIPIFDESDLNNSIFEPDFDSPEFTISSRIPSVILENFLHRHAESQASNEALEMQNHSSTSDNDIKACNDKENWKEDPNNKAISENKGNSENKTNSDNKANSENKTKSESNENSEKLTYSASFISMSNNSLDSDDSLPSSSKKLTSDELKQTRNHTYLRTQIHPRKASAIQALEKKELSRKRPASDDQGISDCQIRDRVKRRAATVELKHIIPRNSVSEMEEDSKSDNIAKEKDNVEKDIEDNDIYTKHMIRRIPSLPLPSALIRYLNYERNNL